MASSTRSEPLRAVLGAFAIVGAAVCIGMGHSLIEPVQLKLNLSTPPAVAGPQDPTAIDLSPDDPTDETDAASGQPRVGTPAVAADAVESHRLNLEQAHDAFYEGAVFLDARPRDEYDHSRVEGALHLPAQTISGGQAGEVLDTLISFGYDHPLVLYCHGGDCDASENTAIRLQQMGFTNIRIMTASFNDWQAAGFEVETP